MYTVQTLQKTHGDFWFLPVTGCLECGRGRSRPEFSFVDSEIMQILLKTLETICVRLLIVFIAVFKRLFCEHYSLPNMAPPSWSFNEILELS